jgi:hypothetical protein
MAELILRPDAVTAMGSWDPTDTSAVIAILGDPGDTHTVYNTNANQPMQLSLADIPELYSEETFTTITATINARKGGKGNASTSVKILDGFDEVVSTDISISSVGITAYTTELGDISSMSVSDINDLQFYMIGLDNTQAFYQDVWVTLTYQGPPPVQGVKLSSGKLVLTGKVTF